jgi:hypothetical protein
LKIKINDHLQEFLEWEIIDPDQEVSFLTFETNLYDLNRECIIRFTRDNQYRLFATISGIIENRNELELKGSIEKGEFITTETVMGFSSDGLFKYKFTGVFLGKSTLSPMSVKSSALKFQADFIFSTVEKSIVTNTNQTAILQEWYLTGYSNVNFTRSTSRGVDKSFKRLRDGIDPEEERRLITSSGSYNDYLLVKYIDTSFIVSKVPKEFGPEWSFNISIEYRQSFGRIPNENDREAISELVGFVLGNQLLKIGQTSYDKSTSLIIQEYQSPWGDNVVSRCQSISLPPVELGNYQGWNRAEILLNELINSYLTLRNKLRLKDALWKYWIAKYSTLGANLPILSSAVETLAEQVIKSHPEVKLYYIDRMKFLEIIKDELVSIEQKLEGNSHKTIIINKLKGATVRGSNEKLDVLFEIIDLKIGKIEREAIKARNKMAHSSLSEISEEEIKETIRYTRAYETLFNRIFLKILSYSGEYKDYYTIGHPSRLIGEPIHE